VMEIGYVQHIIAPPAVRIDDAVRDHLALNDRDRLLQQSGPQVSGMVWTYSFSLSRFQKQYYIKIIIFVSLLLNYFWGGYANGILSV